MATRGSKKLFQMAMKHMKTEGRKNGWNLHMAGGIQKDGAVYSATFFHKWDYEDGEEPLSIHLSVDTKRKKVKLTGDMDPVTDKFQTHESEDTKKTRQHFAAQAFRDGTDIDDYEPKSQGGGLQPDVPPDSPDDGQDEASDLSEPSGEA
jgi:hypothetical protein